MWLWSTHPDFLFTLAPGSPAGRLLGIWMECVCARGGGGARVCVWSSLLPAQQRDDLTCMAGELHKNVPKRRICEAKRACFQNN